MELGKFYQSLFLFWLSITMIISGCKKDDYPRDDVKEKAARNVLVYIEANNNLESEALNSINGLEQGALNIDGVLLVYIKTTDTKSYLLKIKHDSDTYKIISDTVKTFNDESFSNPAFLRTVIEYSQKEFPADSYGLILWSHATSWAPPVQQTIPQTKAFGNDRGNEMDIIELKNALPNNFDFLIFDACNMASLEVLFEFKDKAKYIIASPSETIAESFPYQEITPLLFKSMDALKNLAEGYFNYYNSYIGFRQSATISLIKTDQLNSLAKEMKLLIQKNKSFGDTFIINNVQRMDFTSDFPVPMYDFLDFVNKNFINEDLAGLVSQLNKTILYKANTSHFLGSPIKAYSGLTCYAPAKEDINLSYYQRFQWYRESGFNIIFEKL